MKQMIIIWLIIFLCLLFSWWASGEIYNPRPTEQVTITLPQHVTATEITTYLPPTSTIAVTYTPTTVYTATPTVALPPPTKTPQPTTQQPTATYTPVPSYLYAEPDEHDCISILCNIRKCVTTYSCFLVP